MSYIITSEYLFYKSPNVNNFIKRVMNGIFYFLC